MSNLIPIEFQNQRVMTTKQLADSYETEPVKIQQNFSNNKDRYIQGVHYFILEGEELKALKRDLENFEVAQSINKLYVWTEKGTLLHAKSLNTDKAWQVYEMLVDTYFRTKQQLKPTSALDALQQTVAVLVEQQRQLEQQGKRIQLMESTVTTIKETIITPSDNWRENTNKQLNRIADKVGGKFQEIRSESYVLLEQRAHVDLERRLTNKRARMLEAGRSKTEINKANKLDCIEEDPKLREIYNGILKEYVIKFCA